MKKIVSAMLLLAIVVASVLAMASCSSTVGPDEDPAKVITALEDAGYDVEIIYGLANTPVMNIDVTFKQITAGKGENAVEVGLFRTEAIASAYFAAMEDNFEAIAEEKSKYNHAQIGNVIYGGMKTAIAVMLEGNDSVDVPTALASLEAAGYTVTASENSYSIPTALTVKYTKLTATNPDGKSIEVDYFLNSGMAAKFYALNVEEYAGTENEDETGTYTYLRHSSETYVYNGHSDAAALITDGNPDTAREALSAAGYSVEVARGSDIELEGLPIDYMQYTVTAAADGSFDNNGTHLVIYHFTNEVYADEDLSAIAPPVQADESEDTDGEAEDEEGEDNGEEVVVETYKIYDESATAKAYYTADSDNFKTMTENNSNYAYDVYGRLVFSGDKNLCASVEKWIKSTGKDKIVLTTSEEDAAKKANKSIVHDSLEAVEEYEARVNTLMNNISKVLLTRLKAEAGNAGAIEATFHAERVPLEYMKISAFDKSAEVKLDTKTGLIFEAVYCESDYFDGSALAKAYWDNNKKSYKALQEKLSIEGIDYDYFIDLQSNKIVYHGLVDVIDITKAK
ncbi:MAG: hypothetical protein IJX38_05550 [Clostridia bacterium]|nr:hypothetical protein [Clostridia bacterium]